MVRSIRVWDAPLRVFHWLLAAATFGALYTGWQGGSLMQWHGRLGVLIVALLAFRLSWMLVGSTYARIDRLLCSVLQLPRYFKGQWHQAGHNPLGVLSVFALLGLLTWQAVTGLFTYDDIAFRGPLARLVSTSTSLEITSLHRLGLWFIVGLISLHILAIALHALVKKHNLVKPMITGQAKATHDSQQDAKGGGWIALVFSLIVAAGAYYLASGAWVPPPPPPAPSAFSF
ncbi:cytochrome b/b6 domain-containing protein [Thiopseudomonas alkaliphila]|uniref:Cytochrome B n=1 Tax=Thiopseudomonas alkaliphila TaxID=1697053 RepID=A0A0K1XEN3_9GAMM|nr:cytochrome b/b6 domain-containing protein [Thiopseudomonas alkaliphila]AKX59714.1 cytochrome B [Thiopseudomonas alkaliphila]MDM1716864.1 cytochrome b/b6 domain-containing protein [Thiopseudomonas alkaliphila]